jgi:hypothetical protein
MASSTMSRVGSSGWRCLGARREEIWLGFPRLMTCWDGKMGSLD